MLSIITILSKKVEKSGNSFKERDTLFLRVRLNIFTTTNSEKSTRNIALMLPIAK